MLSCALGSVSGDSQLVVSVGMCGRLLLQKQPVFAGMFYETKLLCAQHNSSVPVSSFKGLFWVLQLVVDASNVPSKYILTILSECATFPRRLIFFVKGSFGVSHLWCCW